MNARRLYQLSAALDERIHNFGDRARDAGGRYSPGQTVSAGEMADAYLKPKKKNLLLTGAGAGLATAAALGGRPVGAKLATAAGRMLRDGMH